MFKCILLYLIKKMIFLYLFYIVFFIIIIKTASLDLYINKSNRYFFKYNLKNKIITFIFTIFDNSQT